MLDLLVLPVRGLIHHLLLLLSSRRGWRRASIVRGVRGVCACAALTEVRLAQKQLLLGRGPGQLVTTAAVSGAGASAGAGAVVAGPPPAAAAAWSCLASSELSSASRSNWQAAMLEGEVGGVRLAVRGWRRRLSTMAASS